MQIVINIPDDLLERVKNECRKEWAAMATPYLLQLFQAVANGTPLEKGHGELIERKDAMEVVNKLHGLFRCVREGEHRFFYGINECPTIIEADKEE